MSIPTPHNTAKKGDIAKKVLMPGDPLRAKYIAETYLENPVCFNTVRNMFGYTGTYKGQQVSVMGGGMGMPSMGIYSYELYNFYDVEQIIRIGSAGALQDDVNVMDVVIAMSACTDSNYGSQYKLPGTFAPTASYELVAKAVEVANLLVDNGVKAIWNFAHTDLNLPDNIIVENVHLSESLMRLSYNITRYNEEHEGK